MKNIRLFIVSSSLLLTVWLSASYVTDTSAPANQLEAATPSNLTQEVADTAANGQSKLGATTPVSYILTK